ncbi:MAG: Hpt domain-containing protein [Candidatus Eisenbacteria bacterium]
MSAEFDYAQLDAITGGDEEFEREVLQEYLNSVPLDLIKLRTAIGKADASATSATAHAIKGSSATIGATGFAAIAFELEHAGARNELGIAPDALQRLCGAFVELEVLLRERLAKAA